MGKRFFKNHFLLLLSIACMLIISCSNSVPQIQNTRFCVVFDYAGYDALPEARLSIFVETSSNPRRFDTITVSSNKNEYVWEATDLILAADENNTYCGTTNLIMPAKEQIPTGEYTIVFRQSDDEKSELKRILSYDKTFYDTKASDVPALMKRFYGTKMLTVYDESDKIIYYGPRSDDLSDARGIWNNYREAAEFQESWVSQNGTVICNMPLEKVKPGN